MRQTIKVDFTEDIPTYGVHREEFEPIIQKIDSTGPSRRTSLLLRGLMSELAALRPRQLATDQQTKKHQKISSLIPCRRRRECSWHGSWLPCLRSPRPRLEALWNEFFDDLKIQIYLMYNKLTQTYLQHKFHLLKHHQVSCTFLNFTLSLPTKFHLPGTYTEMSLSSELKWRFCKNLHAHPC